MRPEPIFFACTRSFWLGVVPALLTAVDLVVMVMTGALGDPTLYGPVAEMLSWVLPVDPVRVQRVMQTLAPVYALIVAQQRAGAARPYTINPRQR
ncbi:MAG: hypothetical protein IT544_02275 [Rhodobacteraceae bacterium]|nr:hypothetical protein [Paracoccaceae bacterium]